MAVHIFMKEKHVNYEWEIRNNTGENQRYDIRETNGKFSKIKCFILKNDEYMGQTIGSSGSKYLFEF